jgi:hypothetical protein
LSEHQASADASPTREPPIIPLGPWCIAKIKSKFHKRRAEREEESAQDRSSRRTASATIWIAIFAVIAALVGISQAIIGNRQLSAMQGQLNETQIEQRAWLNPEAPSFRPLFDRNAIYIFGNTVNTGHIPATEVIFSKIIAGFLSVSLRFRQIPHDDICEWDPAGTESNIYPGEKLSYERVASGTDGIAIGPKFILNDYWNDVENGAAVFYFRDCVTYATEGKRHYRNFCFYTYRGPIDGALHVAHCPVFNKGD